MQISNTLLTAIWAFDGRLVSLFCADEVSLLGAGYSFDLMVDGQAFFEDARSPVAMEASGLVTRIVFEERGLRITHKAELHRELSLLRQSLEIEVLAGPPRRLTEVHWRVPGLIVGAAAECLLQAPGQVTPPDLPYLDAAQLPLDGIWVLLGSFIVPGAPHQTHYFLGDFDGRHFTAQSGPRQLSFGPDDYAAVSFSNAPDGRRIILGWMNRWDYAAQTPAFGARGAMTLPRELAIRDGNLCQSPVPELQKRRGAPVPIEFWPRFRGRCFEIEATVAFPLWSITQPPDSESAMPGCGWEMGQGESLVRVLLSASSEGGEVRIERGSSSHVPHPGFGGVWECDHPFSASLQVRIFVDASSVEVFVGEGKYGAALFFPAPDETGVRFFSREGASLLHGALYPLIMNTEDTEGQIASSE